MAKHGGPQIAIREGYRVAGSKGYIVKDTAIFSQRNFAFGAAIQIIENHLGEPPLRCAPQIMDIHDMWRVDGRHAHSLQCKDRRIAETIKPQFSFSRDTGMTSSSSQGALHSGVSRRHEIAASWRTWTEMGDRLKLFLISYGRLGCC
jgi:hypothetical protein